MKIIGLSGSLRSGSYNTALLKAAQAELRDEVELQIYSIYEIPLFDGDQEMSQGIPAVVRDLKEALINSDGLLIATPEYNHSIPGVLKNAIDWLSRPPKDIKRVFGGLPVAIMGASPSGFGTILAQEALLPVLRTLGTRPWFGKSLHVSHADKVFDVSGKLIDSEISKQLGEYMQGFVAFINSQKMEARIMNNSLVEEQHSSLH